MTKLWRMLVFLALPAMGTAQTGPAGVGSTGGGSSLQMWYEGRDLNGDNNFSNNPSNGSMVTSWTDKSGNNRNMSAPSGNEPYFGTGLGVNTVNFSSNGAIQYMNVSSSPGQLRPGTMYFFYYNTDVSGDGAFCFFDESGGTSVRVAQWNNTDRLGFTRYGVSDYATGTSTNFGAFNIASWRRPGGSSTDVIITQNATAATLGISSSSVGLPTSTLGKNSGSDGANYSMGEILVYNTDLNLAQRNIIENYLSAKYSGTGTAVSIPDDIYTMDNNSNGNFDYDVAGIGMASDNSTHTTSRGTGIIQLSNPSGLGADEYMFWGHDNGSMLTMNTTDIPSGMKGRFSRIWRVSERGNVGNVDIDFDLTGMGPVNDYDLRLLIDTDNDGVFTDETPVSGASAQGSNIYRFSAVSGMANNLRFTLGTASIYTPLPVEILTFSATALNKHEVLLEWATTLENNSSHFEVQRSHDMKTWLHVNTVPAAGVAVTTSNYSCMDHVLLNGTVYYRLKQVNKGADFVYSTVKSIQTPQEMVDRILIYPNPANYSVVIEAPDTELSAVSVSDMSGRTMKLNVIENSNGRMVLDISGLAAGKYIVRTASASHVIEKQ